MVAVVTAPLPAGLQTEEGRFSRRIDASTRGGPNGPIRFTANAVVPAYGTNNGLPASPDCDSYYAGDATGGNITLTAPAAASTPLGTTITLGRLDASGNTLTFITADGTAIAGSGMVPWETIPEPAMARGWSPRGPRRSSP